MMVIHTGDIQQDRLGIDPLGITKILWRGNGYLSNGFRPSSGPTEGRRTENGPTSSNGSNRAGDELTPSPGDELTPSSGSGGGI